MSLYLYIKRNTKEEKKGGKNRKKGRDREDASLSSISNFFLAHCAVIKTPGAPSNGTKYKIGICEVFLSQVVMYFPF